MNPNPDGQADESERTQAILLSRLKDSDDDESWRQFYDKYWRLIHRVAIQAGLRETEAQDAVQETVISVAKSMPSFRYHPATCSFRTWLRHIARKRIIDQFRKRMPASVPHLPPPEEGSSGTEFIARIPDPQGLDLDTIWDHEWEKAAFDTAVATVRTQASTEQFLIFDYYVLREWPVKKVAATLRVSPMQVYLARHRILRLIKKEIKRLEKEGL